LPDYLHIYECMQYPIFILNGKLLRDSELLISSSLNWITLY
jgi:hypothetical protein